MANPDHYAQPDNEGHEVPIGDIGNLVSMQEVNQQIATAKRYPRSITKFIKQADELVSLNQNIAEQCTYVLKRGGKTIEGPSARFAEIINSTYGNIRSAARVVDIGDEFITAEGICYDLEKNNAIRYEVMRRITDKDGHRYNSDMIGVTGNAACSIALRNAILKVVPKAFWNDVWEKAKDVARGDEKTFASRRENVLETFKKMGVTPQQIYDVLGIGGLSDLTRDHMVTLAGIITAIKDGDTTVEQAFGEKARGGGQVQVMRPGTGNEFVRKADATEVKTTAQPEPAKQPEAAKAPEKPQEAQTQAKAPEQPKPAEAAPQAQAQPQQASLPVEQEREPGDDSREIPNDDRRAMDYHDWYKDQKARITACKFVRDIGPIREEVGMNLETAAEQKDWNAFCDAKRDEILAAMSTGPAKGKGGSKR